MIWIFFRKVVALIPGTTAKIRILREGTVRESVVEVVYAEARMESDLIAPIIAKRGGKAETAVYMPSSELPAKTPQDAKFPSPRPDTFAIVIGIDYKNRQDIPNLNYASTDAKKIYSILTDPRYGGVPKENAVLLLNEKATRNEMISALRTGTAATDHGKCRLCSNEELGEGEGNGHRDSEE